MRDLELNARPGEEVAVCPSTLQICVKPHRMGCTDWATECSSNAVTPRNERALNRCPFAYIQEFDGNSTRGFKLRRHVRGEHVPAEPLNPRSKKPFESVRSLAPLNFQVSSISEERTETTTGALFWTETSTEVGKQESVSESASHTTLLACKR